VHPAVRVRHRDALHQREAFRSEYREFPALCPDIIAGHTRYRAAHCRVYIYRHNFRVAFFMFVLNIGDLLGLPFAQNSGIRAYAYIDARVIEDGVEHLVIKLEMLCGVEFEVFDGANDLAGIPEDNIRALDIYIRCACNGHALFSFVFNSKPAVLDRNVCLAFHGIHACYADLRPVIYGYGKAGVFRHLKSHRRI